MREGVRGSASGDTVCEDQYSIVQQLGIEIRCRRGGWESEVIMLVLGANWDLGWSEWRLLGEGVQGRELEDGARSRLIISDRVGRGWW